MGIRSLAVLTMAALVGISSVARADEWRERFGAYASGTGGGSAAVGNGDLDLDEVSAFGHRFKYELDDGLIGSGAAGVYSGPLRGEFEISYRENDVSSLHSNLFPDTMGSGDMSAISFMLNGYYDLPITDRLGVYLGGGVGIAAIDFDASAVLADGSRYKLDADSAAVCVQFMAGLDIKVVDRVHAIIGYRIWVPLDADVDVRSNTSGATFSTSTRGDDLGLPAVQSIEVGLRIDL